MLRHGFFQRYADTPCEVWYGILKVMMEGMVRKPTAPTARPRSTGVSMESRTALSSRGLRRIVFVAPRTRSVFENDKHQTLTTRTYL